MRSSIITSLALACGTFLGLAAFGASATIIHVGLKEAAGDQTWESPIIGDPHGYVVLSGWEYDDSGWTGATITYKDGGGAEIGEGVACNQFPTDNACGQKEIGATPWQMLDLNISHLTGWSSLTLYLGSVNATGHGSGGGAAGDETGYLLGAKCAVDGGCAPIELASCTDFGNVPGAPGTCSFTLTYADLLGISDIWVTPSMTNPDGSDNANILLGGDFVLTTVPEPKALGIFGFGLLLLGLFVGLRRRRTG
ncbi:MAG: hypothetical protein ABI178_14695 [Rhodanobacter sp.]